MELLFTSRTYTINTKYSRRKIMFVDSVFLRQNEETSNWTACYTTTGEYIGELQYVHSPSACSGARGCAIHNRPSEHPLKNAPMLWRNDRGILERICQHGVGHPDHDSAKYLVSIGQESQNIHNCDGCCQEEN
jgi:hypothetical protein